MKKEDIDKEIMYMERKYRSRLTVAWLVLIAMVAWLVSIIF